MYLRPAREPRADVEPVALVVVVLLHLVPQCRTRADDAHVAPQDVPELRELVDRGPAQDPTDPRDPAVALVDRVAGADVLGPDDHRAELEDVEVDTVLAHPRLAVHDRASVLELRRERSESEQRARQDEAGSGDRDVGRTVHRVPFALSQVCGVPERR